MHGVFEKLAILNFASLDSFFDSYLEQAQGSVTTLYNRYEADIVHRAEDIPHAFIDLLDTLGVPCAMKNRAAILPVPVPIASRSRDFITQPWLKRKIRKTEQEAYERYDY